jgi:hypothetical protein
LQLRRRLVPYCRLSSKRGTIPRRVKYWEIIAGLELGLRLSR